MDPPEENKVIIDGTTYYGGLNQPRHFVKVNVDCWEKIFDFLSFRDVLAMSQTCQRMRQIGGYYFRENFHGTTCILHKFSGPSFRITNKTLIALENCEFLRFVDSVSICGQMHHLEHYSECLSRLTTLQLCFVNFDVNDQIFEERVLANVESVEFNQCYIYGNSVSRFLALCPKLKRLKFDGVDFEPTIECNFFQQFYPALEYFQYTDSGESAPLASFLERNSSIKYLRLGKINPWIDRFKNTSTIQVDCLDIKFDLEDTDPIEFANHLKALSANGFYRKLHLSMSGEDNSKLGEFINEMSSLKALEVLSAAFHWNIGQLTELKELNISGLNEEIDLKTIAEKLTKLERLWIDTTIDLSPFLCYSKSLKIVIINTDTEYGKPENTLNLFELNQLRQINGLQRKVVIGLFEDTYLASKWKTINSGNYDLIEITRTEKIHNHFCCKDMFFGL